MSGAYGETSQTLSPGFFDPLNDTSLEVTIPQTKNVDENAVVKMIGRVTALFVSTGGCACAKKKIQKVYSY
jgi:hypothetical protein